jgi:hypothetical protein
MRSPFLFLVLLTGCSGPSDKDDTASGGDDTGETDEVVYDQGCITVDGGGGYAHINDAITVAPEGAVIALCDGTYEEAVIIDKAVTLRGASVAGTLLNGPGADIPLTITATGVTVENLVITSARTGVDLKSGSEATLSMITVAESGSWGVSATDATAVITGLTVVEPAAGGVQVSGGTVSIADTSLEYPGAFGVDITDDAVVTITNTTITGTVMLSDDVTDGFAVQIDGGTLSMSGSTIAGADGMGISATDADITLVDTTIQDAFYIGIYGVESSYDLSGVTLSGSQVQGIYADGSSFTMASSTVSASVDESCSYPYEDWNVSPNGPWCGGMFVVTDTATLTDVDVSGWNNYGYILVPNTADLATISVTGGTIDNVGRWGAYLASTAGTITGLTVSNLREPELTSDLLCGYVDRSTAVLAVSSELEVDGLVAKDSVGWGFTSLLSEATITNSTFDGNGCYGFANYQSTATISGSTFTNGSSNGGIYEQEGVLILDGNTFTSNKAGSSYEYDYGDYIYRSSYSGGQGQDIFSYNTGSLVITGNTFSGGDTSLYLSGATEAEISGNTWTDYESYVLFTTAAVSPPRFTDNVVDDVVGPVVQVYYGEVEVENVQVGTTRISASIDVSYEFDYPNDDEDFGSSYSSQSSSSVFYAYGYYYDDGTTITEETAALSLRDVTVTSAYSSLIYASDASLDVAGLEAGTVGGSILNGYWYGIAPDVEIDGLTAGTVASSGVTLYNYPVSDYGSVVLSDLQVDSVGGDGVSATAIGDLTVRNATFDTVYGAGVSTVARSYDYYYDYADDGTYLGTVYVDLDAATEVTIDGLTLGSASGNGVSLSGGSATIAGLAATGVSGSGIDAQGLTTLVVSGSTITAPGRAGVTSTGSYSYYSYESSTYLQADGSTAASITNTTVTNAGGDAYSFDGGSVTMSGVSGSSTTSSGLSLANVTADVQENTFSGNAAYGMTCDDTVLSVCATNDLSGNTMGTQLGCAESCAE